MLIISSIKKHLETEEELKVAHCHLKEQEETIDKLRVNLSEKEAELSSFQKDLEKNNDELQRKVNWGKGTVGENLKKVAN